MFPTLFQTNGMFHTAFQTNGIFHTAFQANGMFHTAMEWCIQLFRPMEFSIQLFRPMEFSIQFFRPMEFSIQLIAFLSLSSWCLVIVVWLFLWVPWVRVLTRILKIGVKMLFARKTWSFTILFYWHFLKSWSQNQKVGVK